MFPACDLALAFLTLFTPPLGVGGAGLKTQPAVSIPATREADPRASAAKVTRAHDGVIDSGSGTVVLSGRGRSLVLTNWHVVPKATGKILVHLGGRSYPAVHRGSDGVVDLTMLEVAAELPAVELATELPAVGTTLRQFGFPGGGPQTPKSGPAVGTSGSRRMNRVSDAAPPAGVPTRLVNGELCYDGGEVYYVDFPPQEGDSGSGLFDPAGRLVAVNWGGFTRENCVHLDDVRRFVALYRP
jgi:S1-C subfamily serine protease